MGWDTQQPLCAREGTGAGWDTGAPVSLEGDPGIHLEDVCSGGSSWLLLQHTSSKPQQLHLHCVCFISFQVNTI